MTESSRPMASSQRGVTLIELMIGMVIGLLAVLVISQVAILYEGRKRTITSGAALGQAVAAVLQVALDGHQRQRAADLRIRAGGDGALAALVQDRDLADHQHREQADDHADHQLDQRHAALPRLQAGDRNRKGGCHGVRVHEVGLALMTVVVENSCAALSPGGCQRTRTVTSLTE